MWRSLKEGNMFPDINEIRKTRKRYNKQMYQSGIKTFRELGQLEANALKDGVLAQKYKELIALGISISNGCYG
jgi:alkylhydroperoxidase/carboxymuconolactone decarboxylase family protein YurZ